MNGLLSQSFRVKFSSDGRLYAIFDHDNQVVFTTAANDQSVVLLVARYLKDSTVNLEGDWKHWLEEYVNDNIEEFL